MAILCWAAKNSLRGTALSMTLAINLCHVFSVIGEVLLILAINTGGQFATGINDTGGKFAPVSTTRVANNGNNIKLSELEGKHLYI
jgi:hypothetical protein